MSEPFDKERNAGWTKYEKKDEETQVSALDEDRSCERQHLGRGIK
jgi:hypothetical protein